MEKTRSLPPSYGSFGPVRIPSSTMTYLPDFPVELDSRKEWFHQKHLYSCLHAYEPFDHGMGVALGGEYIRSSEFKRPLYNNCTHTRLSRTNYAYSINARNIWVSSHVTGYYAQRYGGNVDVPAAIDYAAVWNFVDDGWREEAYWTMKPRFEGEVSMLNFLFELKDFKSIVRALTSGDRLLNALKKLKIDSFNSATKRTAEAWLTKSFAVDPLISDVSTIIGQAQQIVMDAQQKFYERGVSGDTRHFSKSATPVQSFADTRLAPSNVYRLLYGSSNTAKFTATMLHTYQYQCRSRLQAFLNYWGLIPNIEAFWNAIPFSFLADYFVSIGHSLHVMKQDPNLVNFHVQQYCESVLKQNRIGYFVTTGIDPGYQDILFAMDTKEAYYLQPTSYPHVHGTTRSIFERRVCEPKFGPALPKFKLPSGKQASNMAALIRCLV